MLYSSLTLQKNNLSPIILRLLTWYQNITPRPFATCFTKKLPHELINKLTK